MAALIRSFIVVTLCWQAFEITLLEAAKQHVQLSDSYLPVAMQVIAHLTDQMAFDLKDEPGVKPPTTKPTTQPTTKPTARPVTTSRPLDLTTPFHRPGYYAPASPPKPSERVSSQNQIQNNVSPQNQQQLNVYPQNEQQNNVPSQNQQQYNTPLENQQQYNFPAQNYQQYTFPSQNPQQYNLPTQNQQQYTFPSQNQQQYTFPSQNQQQYNYPSQNQQLYNFPSQNLQQYYFPSQNQQQYDSSAQNQQQYYFPSQNQQQYDSLSQQQQYYAPPQNQQQYIYPQNTQEYNISQNQYQGNAYQQQYNAYQQNPQQQQYSSAQNQQYGVMTYDFPQYNPIQPQKVRNEEPLLSAHHEEVKPLLEPTPEAPLLLPPHFEAEVDKISSRSKDFDVDELTEENLQYLSQNVREMIRMAHDPHDERLIDVWEGLRAHPGEPAPKGKMSASNLRLLLLYDLLSREAKRQKLSDYSGFSPEVMKTLVESSGGGARAQLSMALSKMVERHDCAHEYANNRAKEMVTELAKDESKLSSEIRYLQPLVYKY